MRALVVFYSKSGTTRQVGTELAQAMKADSEEIVDTRDRQGLRGWLLAGRDASRKQTTDIKPAQKNPSSYDTVIIGTPIWAWSMTPAVRTYLEQNKGAFKRVAFFCTMGGSGDKQAFAGMEQLTDRKPAAVLALKTMEVRKNAHGPRLKAFTEAVMA